MHPRVAIRDRLPDYEQLVDAIPSSRRRCTQIEYRECSRRVWNVLTHKASPTMKILAARVGNLRGIDLLYAAIIKWTMPGRTQVRSHMAVLQTPWKEAKRLHRVTTVSDWVDKMLTAQSWLEEAGQALGDRVMYDFIIDSLVPPPPPHPYDESYGCAADAPAVAEFVKLQRNMTDRDLLKLVDGICEHSLATAVTAKANKSDVKCQICGHWGHEGKQCEDLKGVQLPRSSGRPHDPPRLKQQPGGAWSSQAGYKA